MDNPYYSNIEELLDRAEQTKLNGINNMIEPCQDNLLSKTPLGEVMIAKQLKRIADALEIIANKDGKGE